MDVKVDENNNQTDEQPNASFMLLPLGDFNPQAPAEFGLQQAAVSKPDSSTAGAQPVGSTQVRLVESRPQGQQLQPHPQPQQQNGPKPRGRRKKIRTEPIRPICPQCEKQFSNQSALTKHKLTHSDERKFACQQCSKAFKRHDHLTGHMQTHSNRKPFNCTIQGCDKTYCDARSLRRHKENIHHIVTPKDPSSNHSNGQHPTYHHDDQNGNSNGKAATNEFSHHQYSHSHHHSQPLESIQTNGMTPIGNNCQQQVGTHGSRQQMDEICASNSIVVVQDTSYNSNNNSVTSTTTGLLGDHNHLTPLIDSTGCNGTTTNNSTSTSAAHTYDGTNDSSGNRWPMNHNNHNNGFHTPSPYTHSHQHHHNHSHGRHHNGYQNQGHHHHHQQAPYSADYATTQHFQFDNLPPPPSQSQHNHQQQQQRIHTHQQQQHHTPTSAPVPIYGSTTPIVIGGSSGNGSSVVVATAPQTPTAVSTTSTNNTQPQREASTPKTPYHQLNQVQPSQQPAPVLVPPPSFSTSSISSNHQPSHLLCRRMQRLNSDRSNNIANGNNTVMNEEYQPKLDVLMSRPVGTNNSSSLTLNQLNTDGNLHLGHHNNQLHHHSATVNNQYQNHHMQAFFSADYASTQHFTFDFNHPMDSLNGGSTNVNQPTLGHGNMMAPHSADSITDSGLGLNAHYEQQLTLVTPPLVDSTGSTTLTNNTATCIDNGDTRWNQMGGSGGNLSEASSGVHLNSAGSGISDVSNGYHTPTYMSNGSHFHGNHHHQHQAPYSADYVAPQHFQFTEIQHY